MTLHRLNDDERLAQDWLRRRGYEDVRRPRSDPPDFVVDGAYAVEVTRLNQRIAVGGSRRSRGEEEARKPLSENIRKVVGDLGSPGNEGRSWVLDFECDFSVPLPARKTVATQISDALAPLLNPYDDTVVSSMHSEHLNFEKHAGELSCLEFPHLCLACGICLDLTEISHEPARFIVQNVSGREGIGVAAELGKGIRNRLRDKSEIIRNQNRVGAYGTWWLVLVDHVWLLPIQMLSEHEQSWVRDQDFEFWDRVVVVSSRNPDWYYDLLPR